jgi:isopenicillin-N epimerase
MLAGGWKEVREKNHELAVKARSILCAALGAEPACPERMLGAMATVFLPEQLQSKRKAGKIDAGQALLYDRFRVEAPFMRAGRPERRCVRVSAHLYNTPAEYEFLGEALKMLNPKFDPSFSRKNPLQPRMDTNRR